MDKHLNQFLRIESLSPFLNPRNKMKKNFYSNTHQTLTRVYTTKKCNNKNESLIWMFLKYKNDDQVSSLHNDVWRSYL